MNKKKIILTIIVLVCVASMLSFSYYHSYIKSHSSAQIIKEFKNITLRIGYTTSTTQYEDLFSKNETFSPLWWSDSNNIATNIVNFDFFNFALINTDGTPESTNIQFLNRLATNSDVSKVITFASTYLKSKGFRYQPNQSNTFENPLNLETGYSSAWDNPLSAVRCRLLISSEDINILLQDNYIISLVCSDDREYRIDYSKQTPFVNAAQDITKWDLPGGIRKNFILISGDTPKPCPADSAFQQIEIEDPITSNTYGGVIKEVNGLWVQAFGADCYK